MKITLRVLLLTLSILGLVPGVLAAASSPEGLVVVELYTSQSCSSCPPADEVLGKLSENPGLLVLSFHVDYWNRNGWLDPFSNKENTERQKAYADGVGASASIYTPQVVVGGVYKTVGSQQKYIEKIINDVRAEEIRVPISIRPGETGANIWIGSAPEELKGAEAEIVVIGYDKAYTTDIRNGENKGQKITNVHVVKKIDYLGRWNGFAQELEIGSLWPVPPDYVAVILQEKGQKRIFGATSDLYQTLYNPRTQKP